MKALIYNYYLEEKFSILITSVFVLILLYTGVENLFSGFVWLMILKRSRTTDEWSFFRTLNFDREAFFKSTIIFNFMKLGLRLSIMCIMILIFGETQARVIYFVSFLLTFFILETATDLISTNFSGKPKRSNTKTFYSILGVFAFLGTYVLIVSQLIWPMERLVYGLLYLGSLSVIYSILNYIKYQGVHYAEN